MHGDDRRMDALKMCILTVFQLRIDIIRLTVYNISMWIKEDNDVRVYDCTGRSKTMGLVRTTSAETLQRKPYQRCSAFEPHLVNTQTNTEAS